MWQIHLSWLGDFSEGKKGRKKEDRCVRSHLGIGREFFQESGMEHIFDCISLYILCIFYFI